MKVRALIPALALAAALLAPPATEAASRHRSDHGRRPPAHGYYRHGPSHGYHGRYYRSPRPYYRGYRYYPTPYYYGFGYYDYGYYPPPPPPPRCCPPRPRIGIWFGF
jgi:hypothetical protein